MKFVACCGWLLFAFCFGLRPAVCLQAGNPPAGTYFFSCRAKRKSRQKEKAPTPIWLHAMGQLIQALSFRIVDAPLLVSATRKRCTPAEEAPPVEMRPVAHYGALSLRHSNDPSSPSFPSSGSGVVASLRSPGAVRGELQSKSGVFLAARNAHLEGLNEPQRGLRKASARVANGTCRKIYGQSRYIAKTTGQMGFSAFSFCLLFLLAQSREKVGPRGGTPRFTTKSRPQAKTNNEQPTAAASNKTTGAISVRPH